jgi:ABC-2 type transport system permease protein
MKQSVLKLFAVSGKEIRILLKDRGILALLFLMPLIFGLMLSNLNVQLSGSDEEEDEAAIVFPIYVVNQDSGPFGQQVTDALLAMAMLDVTFEESVATADDDVRQGEKLAAVVIPAGFSEKIDAYEATEIEVIVDPTQEEYASFVTGLTNFAVTGPTVAGEVQYGVRTILAESGLLEGADPALLRAAEAQSVGAIMTRLLAMQEDPAIIIETEMTTEEEDLGWSEGGIFVFFMTAFAVMFAFFLVGVIGQSLHRDKDNGSLRRLLAAPLSRASIIGGNSLAYMIFVAMQVIFLFGVSAVAFSMPLGDSPLFLLLITIALGLVVATMGLMIAALTKTGKQADSVGIMLGFILAGLGGALPVGPPLYESDGFLGLLSRLTPHAHAVKGFRMAIAGTGTNQEILLQVLILLAFAAVFFAVARWRFKFE